MSTLERNKEEMPKLNELTENERINIIYSFVSNCKTLTMNQKISNSKEYIYNSICTYNSNFISIIDDEVLAKTQNYLIDRPLPKEMIEFFLNEYIEGYETIKNIIMENYNEFLRDIDSHIEHYWPTEVSKTRKPR